MRTIAHASWGEWKHFGLGYKARCRHGDEPTAFSNKDGFMWFDSYKRPISRPASAIHFHGGPRSNQIDRCNGLEEA